MRFRLPHTFTIIFSLIVLVAILSWILPSGKFERKYDEVAGRDIVVAGTYKTVESSPQGFIGAFSSFAKGIIDAAEVIAYVLIIGGTYGVILKTGAIDSGLRAVIKKLQGKEIILIPVIMFLFSLGGTTSGMFEETLAFYLIIIPLMIAAGYDAIVGLAAVLIGAATGCMASILNPFATGIASQIAQVSISDGFSHRVIFYIISVSISIAYVTWYAIRVKKDPKKSIVYSLREDHKEHFGKLISDAPVRFTFRQKLIVAIFASMIGSMMYSVMYLGWWIPEMTMIFLAGSMIIGVISGITQKQYWDNFVEGSKDLLYAALVIGLARAIVIVAQDGVIIDTILNTIVNFLSGLSKGAFIILNEIVQIGIAFLVPSSSGQAALTMPLMAPLADLFNIPRSTIITAYQMSSGLINMVAPTSGVVMAAIGMARITFSHWLRFIIPLLCIHLLVSLVVLILSIP